MRCSYITLTRGVVGQNQRLPGRMVNLKHVAIHVTVLEPNSPTITGATITKETMTVTWTAPSGDVGHYEVELKEMSGTKQAITKERTNAAFYSLTAGTRYTVRLVAVSGDQRSTTAERSYYTSKCVLCAYIIL